MARRPIYPLFLLAIIGGIVVTVAGQAYHAISSSNAREGGEASDASADNGEICTVCGPIRTDRELPNLQKPRVAGSTGIELESSQ
jgi:hypothetical protein